MQQAARITLTFLPPDVKSTFMTLYAKHPRHPDLDDLTFDELTEPYFRWCRERDIEVRPGWVTCSIGDSILNDAILGIVIVFPNANHAFEFRTHCRVGPVEMQQTAD